METGSFLNSVMGGSNRALEPEVGMGCTILCWTDRHAATVVEVRSATTIVVQQDHARRVDKNGMSESQKYEYTPNPEATREVFTRRKDGRWKKRGGGYTLMLGERMEYHDFSF